MMRLGSRYRLNSLRAYRVRFEANRVLDVGCHDGAFLSSLESVMRVGADVASSSPQGSILFVQADGRRLPFRSDSFDQAVALDVIEHVPDDVKLMREMLRVTQHGGSIFVTTPSVNIRIFPPFLTGWISRKWGHHWRRGYTEDGLRALVGDGRPCFIMEYNAPAYRFWYLPLRVLSVLWPAIAQRLVSWAARWDARHSEGHRGFYWMWCKKGNV
jgi:SAM-dependent methyltransferase